MEPPCYTELEALHLKYLSKPVKAWPEDKLNKQLDRLCAQKKPNEKVKEQVVEQLNLKFLSEARKAQQARIKELLQQDLRMHIGRHKAGCQFPPIRGEHTARPALVRQNASYRGVGLDCDALAAGEGRHGLADRAHAAPGDTPGPGPPLYLAKGVM